MVLDGGVVGSAMVVIVPGIDGRPQSKRQEEQPVSTGWPFSGSRPALIASRIED